MRRERRVCLFEHVPFEGDVIYGMFESEKDARYMGDRLRLRVEGWPITPVGMCWGGCGAMLGYVLSPVAGVCEPAATCSGARLSVL